MVIGRKIVIGVAKYAILCARVFILVFIGATGLLYSQILTAIIGGTTEIGFGWPFVWLRQVGGFVQHRPSVQYWLDTQNLFLEILLLTAIMLLVNGALKIGEELITWHLARNLRKETVPPSQ